MTTTNNSAVRERPILFSAPMVRAILDGSKTQTRRVVKGVRADNCLPLRKATKTKDGVITHVMDAPARGLCPYGQAGDRLWVRETWVELLHTSPATDEPVLCEGDKLIKHATSWVDGKGRKRWNYDGKVIAYRATSPIEFCDGDGFGGEFANRDDMPRWRPSIHMPRWACRVVLEVTGVRVERLQDISAEDCIAEGLSTNLREHDAVIHLRDQFRDLWTSTGGDWDANPWVWVVEFKRVDNSAGRGER